MKFNKKLCAIILLLLCLICTIQGNAADTNMEYSEETANSFADQDADYVLPMPDWDWDLPSEEDIYNMMGWLEYPSLYSTEKTLFLAQNGFLYYDGYEVLTRGMEKVEAYVAYSEYSEVGKADVIAEMEKNYPNATILSEPTSRYNCHSYAWYNSTASNPYWIDLVVKYIEDAHTMLVDDIQVGDIVVYYDPQGIAQHSAIITEINGSDIICQSKWGTWPLFEHNIGYVPSNYWQANAGYTIRAYRLTTHAYEYAANNNGTHTKTCTICNYSKQENCSLAYSNISNSMHNASCEDCGYEISSLSCTYTYTATSSLHHKGTCIHCGYTTPNRACTYEYVSQGNGRHWANCIYCDNSLDMACSLTYTAADNGQHYAVCADCNYSALLDCDAVTTYCGDNSTSHVHSTGCGKCGAILGSETEACTFEYVFVGTIDGANYHASVCTECDHKKGENSPCMYLKTDYCTLCGTHKDIVQAAAVDGAQTAE